MKFRNLIGKSVAALGKVKLLSRDRKLAKLDFGMLEVAVMIAALDGEVTQSELVAFDELAKKCRGYSVTSAAMAKSVALRSAGYLTLLAKTAPRKKLLDEFIKEALDALPGGFIYGGMDDVRRAFVMWIAMAMGDGDYSDVERDAVKLLKKTWCDLKTASISAETEQWIAMSPAFRVAYGADSKPKATIKLIGDDFLDQVEAALAKFDEKKVLNLIQNG